MSICTPNLKTNSIIDISRKVSGLIVPILLFIFSSNAQSVVFPAVTTSCTSKDLTLVGAAVTGGDACNSCVGGTYIDRVLELSINNKTGSTRTSFKFWAKLEITEPSGKVILQDLTGCANNIVKNSINTKTFNTINYLCGSKLRLTNIWLAWTDASPSSVCSTITEKNLSPKCGTLESLDVKAGLSLTSSVSNGTCSSSSTPSDGSVNITVSGGAPPYKYQWAASGTVTLPSGKTTVEDLTGITASGTYGVTVTDMNSCSIATAFPVTVSKKPDQPTLCKVEPTLCGAATGSLTVSNTCTGCTYSKDGTNFQSDPSFTSLAAGSSPVIYIKNSDGCVSSGANCSSAIDCTTPSNSNNTNTVMNNLGSDQLDATFTVKVSPNPFSDQIRFTISSLLSGNGRLDIYNIYGQKLKTVFQGNVKQGVNYFDLKMAGGQRSSELVYIFSMGAQKVSGKLIQIGRD